MINLFVYGTLRKGFGNNARFLPGHNPIDAECEGVIRYWVDGVPYPFAKRGEGKIYGELYKVDLVILDLIDKLEGHPRYYKREKLKVKDFQGNEVEAWVYLFNQQ